ncbi:MAG TPA: cellulase family glycosylhydrolase, partial [Nitrososphaera sp.]|nr:cellulase family glycosylhydrolase [Nitrososphaera sp.]
MLLGVGLSALLVSSFAPAVYAAVTFKHFDGNDRIDIASTAELKLTHFVLDSKIRIQNAPTERGYIISKGASGSSNLVDQNYALFIETTRKIGGGFEAGDGTEHYIYSNAISTDVWHSAKLVYDGAKLKLYIDGNLAASKSVSKNPDTSLSGVLRIGANAKALNNFFVGDMDYVKVMNQDTFNVGYYNNFGGTTTDPDPDPTPTPSGTVDCDSKPMNQLRGVAFMDPILTKNERGGSFSAPSNYVPESIQRFKTYGFNLIRVPYYWESYVYNPTQFLNQLDLIAKTAQANNVCVVFDNHHWFTSSYWDTDIGKSGKAIGFPSFVVKSFPSKATYYDTAGPFWNALLSNTLSINGKKIWDVQWDFMSKVINKVDGYSSVAGYEILNEPHLWSKTQYEKLGNYNTYLAQKIRSISDKKIVFDRETTKEFTRDPRLEHKIVPRGVTKLVYGPHLYSVPVSGSGGMKQVQNFVEWSKNWGVEIM